MSYPRHLLSPGPGGSSSRPGLIGTLLFVAWTTSALSNALKITSTGRQTVYVAEHDDIEIGCTFQLEPADTGALDIEWSIMNPDTTQLDRVILTYQHGQQFTYDSPFSGRFEFMEADPSNGNASVWIRTLRTTDTNTFQCKVKQAPGIDSRKVTVGVHVRPQTPECWIDRSGDQDQDVTLHCVTHKGSAPLTYSWNRVSSSRGLPARSTTDRGSGTLVIRNATDQSDGTYQCSVSNLVGQEKCELILSPAATGDSKAGVIVGAVLGALLALLLLLLLLWLLCCCCRRRRHKKDRPYDIREDAAPPVSREPSVRSVRSYKAHQARKAMDPAVYSAMKRDDSLQIPTPEHSPFSRRIPSAPPGESKPFFHI